MFLRSIFLILLLCICTANTVFGQSIIAHFEFDSNETLTQNEVGPDATSINPAAQSNGEGVYSQAGQNIDLTFDESLLSASESIYLEFDFQVQEDYAWLISAGEYDPHVDPLSFFGIGYLQSAGFRVRYYTQAQPNTIIDSDFIQAPGIPLNLNERAIISFIYDKEEGIAYLLKNGAEVWSTPEDQQTPGAAMHWFTKNGEFTVGWGMEGGGSTTPSLYHFKAYNEACGELIAPDAAADPICGPGAATITASGGVEGNYRWYDSEDAEEPIEGENGSTFRPTVNRNTIFYVANVQGPCESGRTPVTVEVLPLPNAPGVQDGESCGPGQVTLTASGGLNGNYRWYETEDATQAIGITGNQLTTDILNATTTYFVSVIGTNQCESSRVPVTAHIYPVPDPPGVEDGERCGPGTVTLNAEGGTDGNYRWYESMNATDPIDGFEGSTFTTDAINTTTTYFVAIVNEHCESTRVPVTATVHNVPAAPTATSEPRCGPGSITLTAAGGTNGSYRWYETQDATSPISGAVNSTFTTDELNSSTTFYVSIMQGNCESTRTAITATIHPLPTPPTVEDQENCGPGKLTFTASGGRDGDYRWYNDAADPNPILGAVNSTYTTENLSDSRPYFVSLIDNNGCESERTRVEAIINQMPDPPIAQNLEQCGPGDVEISVQTSGNNHPPNTYKWFAEQEDTNPAFESNLKTLTVPVSQDTILYVSTSNGSCQSSKEAITITVNRLPVINAGEDLTILKGENVQLEAKGQNGETITCSWRPDGSLDRTDIPNPIATPRISTTYIVTRINEATGCQNSDTVSVFVINKFPVTNAFSPNNDGINDTWEIPNIENYPNCLIKVFNNWGNKVFESEGYKVPWDGTLHGQELPPGTYYYVLYLSGQHEGEKGSVFLLR